ncbi:MAG: type II toxin-antitoxin system RelE/ParE family toxin [Lachnospiraceae bacterium]|nr:type II toxin-antitoxin system RelE/ParE family toxin [Lachnospiraceae bacterium]
MKQYDVRITEDAISDMEQIYDYIAHTLLSPENALGQYNRIADAILTLAVLPERIKIMESEPEHSREIRRMSVDNYSVFFVIRGDTVIVINVLYSASNIQERLRKS